MDLERAPRQSRTGLRSHRLLVPLLAASCLVAGCGGPATPAGSPDAPSGLDAGPVASADGGMLRADAEPEPDPQIPDAAPRPVPDAGPPMSCVDIRNCIVRCDADGACAQRCVDQAPAAARSLHQRAVACSLEGCAADDINCRCERECYGGGACIDVVDECRAFTEDLFCDELCM
jgi:hypothetical protein